MPRASSNWNHTFAYIPVIQSERAFSVGVCSISMISAMSKMKHTKTMQRMLPFYFVMSTWHCTANAKCCPWKGGLTLLGYRMRPQWRKIAGLCCTNLGTMSSIDKADDWLCNEATVNDNLQKAPWWNVPITWRGTRIRMKSSSLPLRDPVLCRRSVAMAPQVPIFAFAVPISCSPFINQWFKLCDSDIDLQNYW